MAALEKLRVERGRMSAMDRRIADYILANARLLRDYSSQQLADALKVSQSSIVKFAQRLGFKGYPDLKLSITEAVARSSKEDDGSAHALAHATDPDAARADALWRSKAAAVRETRTANPPQVAATATHWIADADTLFVAGNGIDADAAHALAGRIALIGRRCIAHSQPHELLVSLASATPRDVVLLVCGHGGHAEWQAACREHRASGGHVIAITRRGAAVVPTADACLVVAAHDPQPHLDELVYEAAMRHLLDDIFLRVIAARPDSLAAFIANRARSLAARGD
jgi:DNA-binding MurR/RpiR family transcriptional regulator